jgi:Uncharacterized protein conserved in bacteria (DUF2252)
MCRPTRFTSRSTPCSASTGAACSVVAGQHLMQAESAIFLGWTRITGPDGMDRDFYVRQLRDWKFSVPIEAMRLPGMTVYAQLCGWTLARAHVRSGDRVALAALPRRLGHVRPGHRRLRRNLRRPERTRLRRAPGRRQGRQSPGHHRNLDATRTRSSSPGDLGTGTTGVFRPYARQQEFFVVVDDRS